VTTRRCFHIQPNTQVEATSQTRRAPPVRRAGGAWVVPRRSE
jgi:hypothetical protein